MKLLVSLLICGIALSVFAGCSSLGPSGPDVVVCILDYKFSRGLVCSNRDATKAFTLDFDKADGFVCKSPEDERAILERQAVKIEPVP